MTTCASGYYITKAGRHVQARKLFEACAAGGYTGAMTWMAQLDDNGYGAPEDPDSAAEWDRRAAAAGDPVGMYNLGLDMMRGRVCARHRAGQGAGGPRGRAGPAHSAAAGGGGIRPRRGHAGCRQLEVRAPVLTAAQRQNPSYEGFWRVGPENVRKNIFRPASPRIFEENSWALRRRQCRRCPAQAQHPVCQPRRLGRGVSHQHGRHPPLAPRRLEHRHHAVGVS